MVLALGASAGDPGAAAEHPPVGNGFYGPFVPSVADSGINSTKPHLSVGPDGLIRLVYALKHSPAGAHRIGMSQSQDGGYTWSPVTIVDDDIATRFNSDPFNVFWPDGGGVIWNGTPDSVQTLTSQILFTPLDRSGRRVGSTACVDDNGADTNALRPQAVFANGTIVAAWWERGEWPQWFARAARSHDGGESWEPTELITDNAYEWSEGSPDLVTGTDGNVYAILHELDGHTHVYRTAPHDSIWIDLAFPASPGLVAARFTTIASNADGSIGVAFAARRNGDDYGTHIFFRESHDFGMTWSGPTEVSAPELTKSEPHLIADTSGEWHLVWRRNIPFGGDVNALYATRPVGETTWTPGVQLKPRTVRSRRRTIDPSPSPPTRTTTCTSPGDTRRTDSAPWTST